MNKIIGEFCSMAEKDTIILPKKIPGYAAPEGQVLTKDGQQFQFVYTPIEYTIDYNLDGGSFDEKSIKRTYTIEDEDYTPPAPEKEGFYFNGWEPKSIPSGSIGNITFNATWKELPILVTGKEINDAFNMLANGLDNIIGINLVDSIGNTTEYLDISSTHTSIYAYYTHGIIAIYCSDAIHCNKDMSHAFEGMTNLYDISALQSFVCGEDVDVNSLFKDCTLLSDVQSVNDWGHGGKFKDITDAFIGTSAFNAGRTPDWYKWNVNIVYMSSSGKELKNWISSECPGNIIYPNNVPGYVAETESIEINSKDIIYTFIYIPIAYDINYMLDDGSLMFAKDCYTIEDEDYYPGNPVKDGYKFDHWDPEYIPSGSTGNVTFFANYTKNE